MTNRLSKNPGLKIFEQERIIPSDSGYYFPTDENFDGLMQLWKSWLPRLNSIELDCIKQLQVDKTDSLVYTGTNDLPIGTIIGPYIGKLVTLRKIENLDYALLVAFDGNEWYWADATTYGNIIAYATHSGDPNCKMEKYSHNNQVYFALKTIKTVRPNELLTFNKTQHNKVPSGVLDHVLEEICNLRYCYVKFIEVGASIAKENDIVFVQQKKNTEPSHFVIKCIGKDRCNNNQEVILGQLITQEFEDSSSWHQTSVFQKIKSSDVVGFAPASSFRLEGFIDEEGFATIEMLDQYSPEPHIEKFLKTKNPEKKERFDRNPTQLRIPKSFFTHNTLKRYCQLEYVCAGGSIIKEADWIIANITLTNRNPLISTGKHLFRVTCVAVDQETNEEILFVQWHRVPLKNPDLVFATSIFQKLKPVDVIRKQYLPEVSFDNMDNDGNIIEQDSEKEFDSETQSKLFLDTRFVHRKSNAVAPTGNSFKKPTSKRKRSESENELEDHESFFFEELLTSDTEVASDGWLSISESEDPVARQQRIAVNELDTTREYGESLIRLAAQSDNEESEAEHEAFSKAFEELLKESKAKKNIPSPQNQMQKTSEKKLVATHKPKQTSPISNKQHLPTAREIPLHTNKKDIPAQMNRAEIATSKKTKTEKKSNSQRVEQEAVNRLVNQLTSTLELIQNANWIENRLEGFRLLGMLTQAKSVLKKKL